MTAALIILNIIAVAIIAFHVGIDQTMRAITRGADKLPADERRELYRLLDAALEKRPEEYE